MSEDAQDAVLEGAVYGGLWIALVMGAVVAGFVFGPRKSGRKFLWWPSLVVLGLIGVTVLRSVNDWIETRSANTATQTVEQNPRGRVALEKVAPNAALDTTASGLRTLEKSFADALVEATKANPNEITALARPVLLSGKQLVSVEARLHGLPKLSALLTIESGELVRVVCASSGDVKAKFKATSCGNLADQTLGVSVASASEDI